MKNKFFLLSLLIISTLLIGCSNQTANINNSNKQNLKKINVETKNNKNIYTNEEVGFSIKFPQNFTYEITNDTERNGAKSEYFLDTANKDKTLTIGLEVRDNNYNNFTQEITSNLQNNEKDGWQQTKINYQKDTTINSLPVKIISYSRVVEDNNANRLDATTKITTNDLFINYSNDYVIRIQSTYTMGVNDASFENQILEIQNSFQKI